MKNTHAKEVISPDIHKYSAFYLTYFCSIFRYFIQNLEKSATASVKAGKERKDALLFYHNFHRIKQHGGRLPYGL